PGCVATDLARQGRQSIVDAARCPRAALAVAAAALDDLTVLGRKLADGALAGEARGDGADPGFQAASDLVALQWAGKGEAGEAAGHRCHVRHEPPNRFARMRKDEALADTSCTTRLLELAHRDVD